MEIPLKEKYTHAMHGRFTSHHNDSSSHRKNKKVKIGPVKHAKLYGAQVHKAMVMLPSGKTRMEVIPEGGITAEWLATIH